MPVHPTGVRVAKQGPNMLQASKRRFVKPFLIVASVVVLVGAFVGLRMSQAKKDEPKKDEKVTLQFTPADVALVEMRELQRTLSLSGSLSPVVQSTVRSKVSGEVTKVLVREGDRVAEGQQIAAIDTLDLKSKVDAQAAALEESKAKETIARKNRENNQALLRQNFISQNAFDTTVSTYEGAAAGTKSAEAQLRIAEKALQDAVIRSPFAGIVSRRMVQVGEKVAIDSALFTVVDLGRMEIEAPAPASEIPGVKVGQLAQMRVDGFGDRVFDGRIERINPAADPGSRSITLYVSVQNKDGALKGGMFAKGQLILDKAPAAAVIPAGAVREEAGQAYVFTIENGKLARRPVTLGMREEGLVEIVSGLERGVPVVRARISDLKPGAPAILKTSAVATKPVGSG
jgi:RND family efflux transporter MFP subunit